MIKKQKNEQRFFFLESLFFFIKKKIYALLHGVIKTPLEWAFWNNLLNLFAY